MTIVQCIHPQDPVDPGTALQQCVVRQGGNAKFRWLRFEVADLEVVDLPCINFPRRATRQNAQRRVLFPPECRPI